MNRKTSKKTLRFKLYMPYGVVWLGVGRLATIRLQYRGLDRALTKPQERRLSVLDISRLSFSSISIKRLESLFLFPKRTHEHL
jgi:hypothetical protein